MRKLTCKEVEIVCFIEYEGVSSTCAVGVNVTHTNRNGSQRTEKARKRPRN